MNRDRKEDKREEREELNPDRQKISEQRPSGFNEHSTRDEKSTFNEESAALEQERKDAMRERD